MSIKPQETKISNEKIDFGRSVLDGVKINHNYYISMLSKELRDKILNSGNFSVTTIGNPPTVIVGGVIIQSSVKETVPKLRTSFGNFSGVLDMLQTI